MINGSADTPLISIVIPAYNEEARLPRYLSEIFAYMNGKQQGFEVLVVDDGSMDNTAAQVTSLMENHPQLRLQRIPRNRGKGSAVKAGMLLAKGEVRLFADADGATPIAELEKLLERIKQGADVAIASRAMRCDDCTIESRLHRKFIGTVFNLLVRTITIRGINDTQCGFKMFTANATEHIFPRQTIKRFGFDIEVLFIARKAGFAIAEVPVNWSDVAGSKVNLLRDSTHMFFDLLAVRRNWLMGRYKSDTTT